MTIKCYVRQAYKDSPNLGYIHSQLFKYIVHHHKKIDVLDISITRDHTGTLDTNIYRKPTHSERYLNFIFELPLEHKSAVVDALIHKAKSLFRDENKKRMELKHIQNVSTLNGYPNWSLN